MRKPISVIVLLILTITTCYAQISRYPTPEYGGVGNNRRLIGISNLFGEVTVGCGRADRPFVGTIVRREFDSD